MAMTQNFRFVIDLEETILRKRQSEPAPPERRRDGHDMTVLEKRMGAEGRHSGRHFNNVSDDARTGNCSEAPAAVRRSFLAQPIVNISAGESVLIYGYECADDDMSAVGRMHIGAGVTGVLSLGAEASDEALVSAAQHGDRS